MKAMPTSTLRNTWSVKVVSYLIWLLRTCKIQLATHIGVEGNVHFKIRGRGFSAYNQGSHCWVFHPNLLFLVDLCVSLIMKNRAKSMF